MREATYQWSEDGIVEYGYVEGEISADEKLCYHCARRIMQGSMFMRFHVDSADPYDLCMPCSRQSIRYIDY